MSDEQHAITVQEHMTCEPLTIGGGMTLADAAQLMRGRNIRHLPVVTDDKVVGLLSERDVHVAKTLRSLNHDKAPSNSSCRLRRSRFRLTPACPMSPPA